MTDEEIENLVNLVEALLETEEAQKHMTEEEKRDNEVKMPPNKGDVWY